MELEGGWGNKFERIFEVDASVIMYHHYVPFQRLRFARSSMEEQKISHGVRVICDGSPSRIFRVRRISFGMTMRPRSSHYVK